MELGPTPQSEEEFTVEWITPILRKAVDSDSAQVLAVRARKNELQGILSTTYVVDVDYKTDE